MIIHTFRLGDLQTNTYILEREGNAIIIDPADDAPFITEELQRRRLSPLAIYGTHGHFDHMLAVGEMQMNFSIPYYLHTKDVFLIQRVDSTAQHFLGYRPVFLPPNNIQTPPIGDQHIGPFSFRILHTPGHTPGSVSFYFEDERAIFTGDTLFFDSIGRSDHSYGSKKELSQSVSLLLTLPVQTIVYPGHGELTSISHFIDRSQAG